MDEILFIKDFDICGFRSHTFSTTNFEGFCYKDINIFIGPNNSGKSNILKFFQVVKEIYTQTYLSNTELKLEFSDEDKFNHLKEEEIVGDIYLSNKNTIHLSSKYEEKLLIKLEDENVKTFFLKGIHFIDTERKMIKLSVSIDWIIQNKLIDNYKECMEKWLNKILDERLLLLVDKEEKTIKFRFCTEKEDWGLAQELTDLGTGIKQVVEILTFLYHKTKYVLSEKMKGANVFIEEPESNLHPMATKRFLYLLSKDEILKKNRYFITSHSSVIIDQVDDNWTITRVYQGDKRETKLERCLHKKEMLPLLDSLGVKPSSLLQSNLVIWVEGPSDKLYIKKWLELIYPQYKEGIHFSFMIYGGALIDYCSVFVEQTSSEANKFIDILATSRYAVVIADRDNNNKQEKLKPRLIKFENRIKKSKDFEHVKFVKTAGREIENYIKGEVFKKVLCNGCFERESMTYKGVMGKKTIKFSPPNVKNLNPNFRFKLADSFDEKFSELYITEKMKKFII